MANVLAKAESGPVADQLRMEEDITSPEELQAELDAMLPAALEASMAAVPKPKPPRKKKPKQTFLNMGEREAIEEDDWDEDEDDISSLGHGELERHREMRYYARLAAWEMPLLASKFAPSKYLHCKTLLMSECRIGQAL